MKDPDFEGCKFILLPPDEERRQVKKKKRSSTIKLVLTIAGMALVAGCVTLVSQRKGGPQGENVAGCGVWRKCAYGERGRRNIGDGTCQELGPQLATFDSSIFDHMRNSPQCLEHVQPKLTLYTRNKKSEGCNLTPQDPSTGSRYYDIPSSCYTELIKLTKVVFLVHGFSLTRGLDQYNTMKKAIIEAEDAGVIVVDWYEGSKIDLGILENATVSSIMSDLINLAPYQQAASNTRYMGAALAVVTQNIRSVKSTLTTHCIGHSLGAHVCGFLGKALATLSAPPLDRITGLDPAGPLFLESKVASGMAMSGSTSAHLAREDANFVDTIHTDSTWLGSFAKTGHQDFYVGENLTTPGKEEKFGYSQPMTKDCLMGSHSLAKDIFLATIQDQGCDVEKVCANIHENVTESCQGATNIKFGYNIDGASHVSGSYPVPSDKNHIKCANSKNIKVEERPLPEMIQKIQKVLKGDVCSFFQTIVGPVREVLGFLDKNIKDMIEKSNKRLEGQKVALAKKLEQLLDSAIVLDTVPKELFVIFEEMQRIEVRYSDEKNKLRNLAKRTKSDSERMLRALNEIIENGTTRVKIPYLLRRLKKLLSYSTRTLHAADGKLGEISISYIKVAKLLKEVGIKIMKGKREVEKYIKKLDDGIETTEDEKNDASDMFRQTSALLEMGTVVSEWNSDSKMSSIVKFGKPIMVFIEEAYERGEENDLIGLYSATKKQVEELHGKYEEHLASVNKTQSAVEERKKELAARRAIITEWHGIVVEVSEFYDDEEWEELAENMREGGGFFLKEAVLNFEKLRDVANKYIEYDNTAPAAIQIPALPK